MKKYCCKDMKQNLEFNCNSHGNVYDCPDILISYSEKFDEYGIIIHDGGQASIEIFFCPWCGERLPPSKRDEWFDKLEELGYNNPFEEQIPEKFTTGKWYEEKA